MRKVTAIDGLPVLNAKAPLTLHVTAADIARADNKNPLDCAVARCIRRETRALEARVHLGRTYIKTNKDHWTRYMTPRTMRAEIIAFDRGGSFEPGEFYLSAPQPSKATGRQQGTMKNRAFNAKAHARAAPKRRAPVVVKGVRTGPA